MPYYILNRNYNLHTTLGGAEFVKGKPTWVIPEIEKAVIGIGGVRADGETPEFLDEPVSAPVLSPVGIERQDALFTAFQILSDRNESRDFTAQGVPTVKAVEKLTSFDVDRGEVVEEWNNFKIAKAEAANEAA